MAKLETRFPLPSRLARLAWLAPVATLLLASCNSVGPEALRGGRSLYNEAIAATNVEQMLLNLVRLRYRDIPIFLEVTSVSTSFSFRSSLSSGVELGLRNNSEDDVFGVNGSVSFDDKPTITYLPLQGEAFATRLLTPIRPRLLVLLANSGWAIDRILTICVQQLGPLVNAQSASGPTPTGEPRFERFQKFAAALRRLQRNHVLSLSIVAGDAGSNGDEGLLGITVPKGAIGTPDYNEAIELLGLDEGRINPDGSRTLVCSLAAGFGLAEEQRRDRVAIVTRSLMSALFFLSQAVEEDPEHAERGLVTVTRTKQDEVFDWQKVLGGVFRVRCGSSLPANAGPSLYYRDRYFWIDEGDLTSKSTVGLVAQLFALQAGKIEGTGPILTLPLATN
jgi:hypothetical protein